MKNKLLITVILFFLFSLTPKITEAASCTVENADAIFINLSSIILNCTGSDIIKGKDYVGMIYVHKPDGSHGSSTSHCAKAYEDGRVQIVITPRHTAENYYIQLKNSSSLPGCNGTGANLLSGELRVEVKPAATVTVTQCNAGLGEGMVTALGCIPTKPDKFVIWFLQKAIGLGGGIAFLLIIWGAFSIITSAGNPEKLNNGKEIIVSAISGLLMIIFSVVLLKIIGVDILAIPGFQK